MQGCDTPKKANVQRIEREKKKKENNKIRKLTKTTIIQFTNGLTKMTTQFPNGSKLISREVTIFTPIRIFSIYSSLIHDVYTVNHYHFSILIYHSLASFQRTPDANFWKSIILWLLGSTMWLDMQHLQILLESLTDTRQISASLEIIAK